MPRILDLPMFAWRPDYFRTVWPVEPGPSPSGRKINYGLTIRIPWEPVLVFGYRSLELQH